MSYVAAPSRSQKAEIHTAELASLQLYYRTLFLCRTYSLSTK